MYTRLLVLSCKLLIKLLRMMGKNGSALPGLIIERLSPGFLSHILGNVENKVIVVTGTNGKTTTTKMLVAGLRGNGKRVVTNSTGSNMTRGLIAALIEDMTYLGSLKPTDWFVFEMDEAYAPIFTRSIAPKIMVALNVLRDQLDRYGEIDTTANLILTAAQHADNFIYNAHDPLLNNIAKALSQQKITTKSFGVTFELSKFITNEQSMHGAPAKKAVSKPTTEVTSVEQSRLTQIITLGTARKKNYTVSTPLTGFHNVLNTAAVVAILELIQPKLEPALKAIAHMAIPFGRGEVLHMQNKSITVALVKNPSGFKSNLETFVKLAKPDAVVFVLNDKFADGRDVSWLWDVQFKGIVPAACSLFTGGIRGYDMALRLKHDELSSETIVAVPKLVDQIMRSSYQTVVIIPTYTALFEVRSALTRYGKVPRIW